MLIRQALLKDVDAVLEIEGKSYDEPWTKELFLNEFGSDYSNFYVFEEDGNILGYIIFYVVLNEVEIANIAISPECRRRNIASKLLNFVISHNSGATFYLEVLHTNIPALNLYKSFGFEVSGIRKNYYGKDKDAILMKLKIKGVNYA